MLFKNQEVSRRRFLQVAGLAGMAWATGICRADTTSSRLDCVRTSTGIRIVATVNPVDSVWALQKSMDSGTSWTTLENEGVVIGSGRIRWDIPMDANEPVGFFRLKLVTVLRIGSKSYRIPADGLMLFDAMTALVASVSSFSFTPKNPIHPTWGQFINVINQEEGKWVFEVNGQKILDAGSSLYVPRLGERIEWKKIP